MKKSLENLFILNHKLTVYVPATAGVNKPIDNTKQVNQTAELLSRCFGGATSTPAVGFWVSDKEGLVKENTTLVFAYADEASLTAHFDEVIEWCEHLKAEMEQEAIALELDNKMAFI